MALTCSEHMEFIPGICSEFICIWPAMGLMFWTLVFPPAMETVMLMLLYIPCCAGAGCVCPVWLNTLGGRGRKKGLGGWWWWGGGCSLPGRGGMKTPEAELGVREAGGGVGFGEKGKFLLLQPPRFLPCTKDHPSVHPGPWDGKREGHGGIRGAANSPGMPWKVEEHGGNLCALLLLQHGAAQRDLVGQEGHQGARGDHEEEIQSPTKSF